MGRISPGPTRWPPGAERRLVPARSNLKPQTFSFSFSLPSGPPTDILLKATLKPSRDLKPVLVHHSRLPSWPGNCLQDPYFAPYGIIRIDGSRIHVRCSPRLGGELLCAPKQLRHYHSPDDLSWDEWRLSDSEVERIDLENAASPEEADELEEMTANEMKVDGYYVVAGIARHEYKQGWKFLTLWDGYGLSEATWEPMSAFIQPDGSINPIFRSYVVENNEGQLLTRAETLS